MQTIQRRTLSESNRRNQLKHAKYNSQNQIKRMSSKQKTDSRKNVLKNISQHQNASKNISQHLVIFPDATNSRSGTRTESKLKTKNDGEACPTKQKFTEDVFLRPTVQMQKSKVRKKQHLQKKNKISAEPNETKLNYWETQIKRKKPYIQNRRAQRNLEVDESLSQAKIKKNLSSCLLISFNLFIF